MARKTSLIGIIHSRGHKLTWQRRLVIEILENSPDHIDAETLYERARLRDPRISLATVYRSLALLKEVGLVEEHQLGENHGHFETVQGEPHYHFQCLACGRVIEFTAPTAVDLVLQQLEQDGMEVANIHLNISGLCKECIKANADLIEHTQNRNDDDANTE